MEQILYLPAAAETLAEYASACDLRDSYEKYGCKGLEVIRCGDCGEEVLKRDMIRGVHMIFYPLWLDFWQGRESELFKEFGSRRTWEEFYMGKKGEDLLPQFQADLDYAASAGAEYVVFHVSDVTSKGVFTHEHTHTDEEVADGAAELINRLLDGKGYQFDFLMENLWWPGLTMTDPALTKRLLDGVHYERKGIMLDLGHLMCSNMELSSEDEAVDYIWRMIKQHGEPAAAGDEEDGGGLPLTDYIKGIHMHQSVTGAYAKAALEEVRKNGLKLAEDYYERFSQVYEFLGHIDTHQPFSTPRVKALIEEIAPKYVVHELMAKDRAQRERMLARQSALLRG